MADINISKRAAGDLRRVWRHIARDSETAADRLLMRIDRQIQTLATSPQSGSLRGDIHTECRLLVVARYRILYEFDVLANVVNIVTVVEPYRDLSDIF